MDLNDNGEGGIWVFDEVELPDGWAFDQLGNRCTVRRGSSPRPAGHPRYFGGGTIPWIKIGDATNTGSRFIERTAEHVNEEGAKCSVLIPAGSLIIANSGVSLGFAAITRVPGCIHDGWLLTNDFRELDRDYLYYCINVATRRLRQLADGTTQPNLNTGIARRLMLPLPPLAEQKAIAVVLGALDDKIELNRRMNATLEAMAQALFQSWFVDFDPVRAKLDGRQPTGIDEATATLFPEHLEDSPLGHIPQGWTAGKLGDIGTNSRRSVQPSEIAPNTPYIALEHMPRRCIALGDWADSTEVASGKSAFKKDEILFGKLRPYFHKVGVAPFDGVCSTDILVLAPKSPEWFGFLLGHASSDELIQFADLASTGTKMPRTNWGDISSFKVALPPKPIAAAFTRVIHPMLKQIHANLHQSRTLATLRDTLLPKLLSGELACPSPH